MCGAEDDSTLLREVEVGDRSQLGPRGYKNRRGPGPESVLGQSEGPLETGVGFLEASFELRYPTCTPALLPPTWAKAQEGMAKPETRQGLMAESLECLGKEAGLYPSGAVQPWKDLRRSWHWALRRSQGDTGRDDKDRHRPNSATMTRDMAEFREDQSSRGSPGVFLEERECCRKGSAGQGPGGPHRAGRRTPAGTLVEGEGVRRGRRPDRREPGRTRWGTARAGMWRGPAGRGLVLLRASARLAGRVLRSPAPHLGPRFPRAAGRGGDSANLEAACRGRP